MAKQPSLAAQAGAVATQELKLPAVFGAPQAPVVGKKWPPIITFAHPKRADEWAKLIAKFKSVNEGDMYFVGDELHKLDVAKLSLVCCMQYWSLSNPAGEMQKATFSQQPHPWKEHIEAVVLVYLPNGVVPANVCFKTTKCPGAKTLSDALIQASGPEWGKESPAHELTLRLTQPFMRFYGNVTLGPTRTSKSSGLPYRPTQCTIHATGPEEWAALKALTENPDTQKQLDEAAQRYQRRLDEVNQKLEK